MLEETVLKEYNLHVVNFNYIFKHYIEKKLINDLYDHRVLAVKSSVVRKLIYHHVIYELCNYVLKRKQLEKIVIFFNTSELYSLEICQYLPEEILGKYLEMVMRKIKSILPLRIYQSTAAFEYFIHKLAKREGVGREILLRIKHLVDSNDIYKFTFEKCKKFVVREGLLFLDKQYFSNLKSKQLLLV